jgi:hypothetical protein
VVAFPGAGAPGHDVSGEVRLYRPSNAGDDRAWPLAIGRDGRQILPTTDLPAGRWIVRLQWNSGGEAYYAERVVILP